MKKRRRTTHRLGNLVRFVLIGMALIFFLFPIYWLIRTGGLSVPQIYGFNINWVPQNLLNYIDVWGVSGFSAAYLHSMIISISATVATVGLSIPVAFSLARLQSRRSATRFLDSLLVAIALPPIVLIIPFYILMSSFGLVDSIYALVLANIVFNLPFCVWLTYSFFRDLPVEIEESGMMDGCSRIGAFMRLSLPLAVTGLAVASILVFIASWNEFLFALVLTRKEAVTAPVAILSLVLGNGGGGSVPEWNLASAAGIWFMVPVVVLAVIMNRYLAKALTLGAVKG